MKISVAMATYNGEKYIEKQIDSLLNQTLLPNEIIVCDDCSSDKTYDILKQYSIENKIIKLYRNDKQIGFSKNFEKAISLSTGDFIFLSDQDDICLPRKIEEMIDIMKNNSNIKILSCNPILIDENGNTIDNIRVAKHKNNKSLCKVNWYDYITLSTYNLAGMLYCVRKDFLKEFNFDGFPHDISLSADACLKDGFFIYNAILQQYRQHRNNTEGVSIVDKDRTKSIESFLKRHKYFLRKYSNNKMVKDTMEIMISLDEKRISNYKNKKLLRCILTKIKYNKYYPIRPFLGDLLAIIKNV